MASTNGSSVSRPCSRSATLNCTDPASSVLFDGNIPTLTGLDGDMWANQLFTMMPLTGVTEITFNFIDTPKLARVEVVMFNCPQWDIGVPTIVVRESMTSIASRPTGDITSCYYPVRICIMAPFSSPTSPTVSLRFNLPTFSHWVHLAEVTFQTDTSGCPTDTTVTGVEATTTPAMTTPNMDGSGTAAIPTAGNPTAETTSETTQTDELPTSGFPVTIIIITAIPVILVLVLIVAVAAILLCCWRCKQKHKEASHITSQMSTHTQQDINLQEVRSTPEKHDHTSLHMQKNDEGLSDDTSDDPEYSVVATEHPVSGAELIESKNPSDHLHDRVDGKRKEKACTQQQTLPFEDEDHLYDEVDKKKVFAHPKSATKKKNHRQSKSSPPTTDYHDEDHDSTPQEGQLYAQVDKSGQKKNRAQESPKLPASQENWLCHDSEHDLIAVREQVTSEDRSYDRVEWNVGKEKESAIPERQFHNKQEEGTGAASKQKVEPLQREDSEYYQVDMRSNSLAETPEEYFHLRHHEKSVPYLEENTAFSASRTDQDDMYAQLDSNAKDVHREHTKPSQDDLYSRIEERKVQTKSASLLRKSRDDRFTQPEEREARTQPIQPSDQPQDHLYAQPDKKKIRAKSSSLLSKSHDNLYAQPEERDVHTPLTSFASCDRLRKSQDHLYAELEEGKGNKASKESMFCTSIKSGKPRTHEYAELEESAQPLSLSSQTSRASLKSKKPQAHVYAQLEEGGINAQQSPLPSKELLSAKPEERRATKTRSIAPHAQPKGKPYARFYAQVEERDMQTQLSSLPPEELLYTKPEKRKAIKKCSTLPPLRSGHGKPQAHLYAQLEERGTSNVRATPPTTPVSSSPSSHLYAQLEERETSGVLVGQSTTSLKAAQLQDDLHTQLEEEDTSDIRSTPPPAYN